MGDKGCAQWDRLWPMHPGSGGKPQIPADSPAIVPDLPLVPLDSIEVAVYADCIPLVDVVLEIRLVVPEFPLVDLQEEVIHGQFARILRCAVRGAIDASEIVTKRITRLSIGLHIEASPVAGRGNSPQMIVLHIGH